MELFCRNRGRCRWNHSWRTLLITAWLGVWAQRASSQGSAADVITAKVGATVVIRNPVPGVIITYTWYRGTAVSGDQAILSYQGPSTPPLRGPQYTGRESVLPDRSLQITDVQPNYTGNYTGLIQVAGAPATTFTRQLKVYEQVPKPTVSINVSKPIEYEPVALTCGNSNSATTILWFFNKSLLLPDSDRMSLSADNRTLTISRVSRSDDGSYQCEAQNPVSNSTSDPLTVTVTVPFGPDHPVITPSRNVEVNLGGQLRLTCTAASVPAAQYQWLHNNTSINNPETTYTKTSVAFEDSGNYTCVASNKVTGLSANVTAIVKISGNDYRLTGGAIAGIAIAVVIFLILVGVLIWYLGFKRPASGVPKEQTEMNGPAAASNPGAPATGKANGPAEDVQYTTVKFAPKSGKAATPAVPEGTVYSEVRRK